MLAPVIIFVYNRPEHTIRTIEALSQNHSAKETEVFIFSDAAKNMNAVDKVEQVRNYIDSLPQKNYFKAVNIKKAESNQGLANSIIKGVTDILEIYEKAIVLEDDLVSSNDFLQYMNEALNFYQDNNKIWSISGYNIPIEIPDHYTSDVYLSYRGCSWGWATWVDRWNKVDWDVLDYNDFKKNNGLRRQLNRGGRDMADMLDFQMNGKIDSWAIRWCYTQSKLEKYTIYPVITRIKNIGLDGTGTHSGVSSHFDTDLNSDYKKCNFDYPGLNDQILRNFQDHYMSLQNYYKYKTKNLVKKLLGV